MTPQNIISSKKGLPESIKLLIGATGIYMSFLYYGLLYEDVLRYSSVTNDKFNYAWFLQMCETAINVILGVLGMVVTGDLCVRGVPVGMCGASGLSQVLAKVCTSWSMSHGLSFPIA